MPRITFLGLVNISCRGPFFVSPWTYRETKVIQSSKTKVRSPSNLREVWTSPWYSILRCEPWEEQEATSGHQQATIWPFRTKKIQEIIDTNTAYQFITTLCHVLPLFATMPCAAWHIQTTSESQLSWGSLPWCKPQAQFCCLPNLFFDFWNLKKRRHEPLTRYNCGTSINLEAGLANRWQY